MHIEDVSTPRRGCNEWLLAMSDQYLSDAKNSLFCFFPDFVFFPGHVQKYQLCISSVDKMFSDLSKTSAKRSDELLEKRDGMQT